jgi:hypothetical protein
VSHTLFLPQTSGILSITSCVLFMNFWGMFLITHTHTHTEEWVDMEMGVVSWMPFWAVLGLCSFLWWWQ